MKRVGQSDETGLGRFVAFARLYGVFAVAFVFVVVGIGLWFSQPAHASAQSRRVVVDPVSGLALWGYDPVAYHTDQKAVKGKHIYEYVWQNVSWVFASEANLEVFKADPELYAPRYGGHGALAMARGYLSGANPQVFALYKGKLYLFYSFPTRAAWVQSLPLHIQRATAHWQKLEPTLTR